MFSFNILSNRSPPVLRMENMGLSENGCHFPSYESVREMTTKDSDENHVLKLKGVPSGELT